MTTNSKKPRIEVVDALRGFAVLGIILLHSIEHFNFYVFPDAAEQPAWLNSLDSGVWQTLFFLFSGKAYSIFALLFGFTFFLQHSKQKEKGSDFGLRFLWRLLLLFLFALFNGLFMPGEVLLMYALVGVVFYFFRNKSNKTVFVFAIILMLQPVEWFNYFMSVFSPGYEFAVNYSWPYWDKVNHYLASSSIWEAFKGNTIYGHKASLIWAWENGRITQSAGLFLIGMLLGRKGLFFTNEENKKFWIKTLAAGAGVFILLQVVIGLYNPGNSEMVSNSVGIVLRMWANMGVTAVWVAGFILLFYNLRFQKVQRKLMPYGRMSLTNYITQSMFGGMLFYGYGAGLAFYCSATLSVMVGAAFLFVQLNFCRWWISKYGQGPFEKLWHKLTWIKPPQRNLSEA